MCIRYIGKRAKLSYKREPYITHEEWATKHVYFSGTAVSPIPGSFQIKYSPHYRKLFALMDRPEVRAFYAKWASQSGKSLFEVILIGKKLDTDPANVTLAFPIKDDIKKLVERKVDPVLKGMKRLWSKFQDYRVAESVRASRELKQLAGGSLLISGSGVKDRKSDSMPLLVMDEIGEFDKGAVAEFTERLKAFSKFFAREVGASTVVHPNDEICTNYNAMETKIEWRYICSKCKESYYPEPEYFKYISKEAYANEQDIDIDDIELHKYRKGAKETAHIECPHCKHKVDTKEKDEMILNDGMDWFLIEGTWEGVTIGADLNSFGSFFVSFDEIVDKLISADGNDVKLEKIWRGYFNRFYEIKHEEKEDSDMLLLGNGLEEHIIPKDTVAVYLTIDNQMDHLYAQITAIEYGIKVHIVYFNRIESWSDAERLFEICQNLKGENGDYYTISKMGIDRRGYNIGEISRTDEADEFVHYMTNRWGQDRVYAMEGHPDLTGGKSYAVAKRKDDSNNRRKLDVKIVKFSNLYMKNKLFTYMDRTIKKAKAEEGDEAYEYQDKFLYINQDNIERDRESVTDHSLTRMLIAEVYGKIIDEKTKKPTGKNGYIPIRKRNDAIDTTTMALSLAEMDMVSMMNKPEEVDIGESLNRLGNF